MNYYRFQFRRTMTPGIRFLLISNVLIFLIGMLLPQLNRYMIVYGGLVPELFLGRLFLWQPLSYMFLHGGFMHIFFNMFALWMFGSELERQWGTPFFLKYYFISGIGAGILSAVIQPASAIPIIGASGAIYGILLGFAIMYPNRVVYINFLFPMKVKYLVMLFAAIELLASMGGAGIRDGVAHITHLSGMAFGYLYLLWNQQRRKISKYINFDFFKRDRNSKDFTRPPAKTPKEEEKELEDLMDRIAEHGYDSLSDKEKIRLLELSGKYPKHRS
ncbi:MAG: rhomboid family intramembrane serine protease [Candidatus Marinimicrobia bacterium]|jgi:membrane associated rhomboid family serine protease|nr:rhomboid family intramembrane serine protease [Candidatus Neomarinimicrobiota bacterium]MDD4961648.1 rhomboid family intramembrane serine protease [Candidatus Neomarinimicrobiota bacterium]MDD5709812.1 rhomboid family intramembrane serine protease [Candidatus Neomarinimicrobiota bacterium]MDX9777965.1 rhomboid family intramembrane serine protease [bacterium]